MSTAYASGFLLLVIDSRTLVIALFWDLLNCVPTLPTFDECKTFNAEHFIDKKKIKTKIA